MSPVFFLLLYSARTCVRGGARDGKVGVPCLHRRCFGGTRFDNRQSPWSPCHHTCCRTVVRVLRSNTVMLYIIVIHLAPGTSCIINIKQQYKQYLVYIILPGCGTAVSCTHIIRKRQHENCTSWLVVIDFVQKISDDIYLVIHNYHNFVIFQFQNSHSPFFCQSRLL